MQEGVWHSSEEFIVPLLANAPSGQQEDVHEQWLPPMGFTFMQKGNPIAIMRPSQTYLVPTSLAKGAQEEKMFHCFLGRILAKHTCIVIVHHSVVSTFQHVTRVQAVN